MKKAKKIKSNLSKHDYNINNELQNTKSYNEANLNIINNLNMS